MSKAKPASSASKSSYEDFLKSVKLYSIALDETTAKLDRTAYWDYINEKGVVREITSNYSIEGLSDDHFNVVAEYSLSIDHEGSKENLLVVTCKFTAHFHALPKCKSDWAERFSEAEARLIIWPYLRSFVSDLTGRFHIPPITIPLALD